MRSERARNVLVVHLEKSLGHLVARRLPSAGLRAVQEADPRRALRTLSSLHKQQGGLAALVVEKDMSYHNGFDIVARARKMGIGAPALIVSGEEPTAKESASAARLNHTGFLVEPFTLGELMVRLAALQEKVREEAREDV